jgi:hypothetical protein
MRGDRVSGQHHGEELAERGQRLRGERLRAERAPTTATVTNDARRRQASGNVTAGASRGKRVDSASR